MKKSEDHDDTVSSNFSSKEWSVYEKVLYHNYMHHKQITGLIEKQLRLEPKLKILELGCGDAGVICCALQGCKDIEYTGIDTSRESLKEAEANLEQAGFAYKLIRSDMAEAVLQVEGPFTVVVAGFSLHHFMPNQIRRILTVCSEKMSANGLLIVYDLVAREGEARENFNQRLMDRCATAWQTVTAEEHSDMANHVMANDFPLSAGELTNLIQDSGFQPVDPLKMLGTDDLFGFVSSRKVPIC